MVNILRPLNFVISRSIRDEKSLRFSDILRFFPEPALSLTIRFLASLGMTIGEGVEMTILAVFQRSHSKNMTTNTPKQIGHEQTDLPPQSRSSFYVRVMSTFWRSLFEALYKNLIRIYDQHNLKDVTARRSLELEERSIPRIICSEALV